MKLVQRSLRLEAPEGLGRKPRPELISPVLGSLHQTLQDAVRMGFLHSSRATGRIPDALKAAAEVRYLGHKAAGDGATVLRFEVPPFGRAAAEVFQQKLLWEDGPKPEQTAFELLGAALVDVAEGCTESSRFDPGLLRRISTYERMLKRGLTRIHLIDARIELPASGKDFVREASGSPCIDERVVSAATELGRLTPSPRRVRVVGRLDLMGASQGVLKLHVDSHDVVTALWVGQGPIDAFRTLFNRDVVLEGLGVFRPSGSLLRVDTDALEPATAQHEFFRQVPTAIGERDYAAMARLKPGEKSAYAKLLGSIPAEESDEEFLAALEGLR